MWREIKITAFFEKKKSFWLHGSVWTDEHVCVENATHAAAYSRRVINGQDFFFFSAEGCWLRDVLTEIWLAKPKTYFITHKTFHLLPRFTGRPSLSVADPQPVNHSFPSVALALLRRRRSYCMIQLLS